MQLACLENHAAAFVVSAVCSKIASMIYQMRGMLMKMVPDERNGHKDGTDLCIGL